MGKAFESSTHSVARSLRHPYCEFTKKFSKLVANFVALACLFLKWSKKRCGVSKRDVDGHKNMDDCIYM